MGEGDPALRAQARRCARLLAGSTFAALACTAAIAQDATEPAAPPTIGEVLERLLTLPANTQIHLRMLEPVASNTHKPGDRFKLEVAEPIVIDGQVVIPAGSPGTGQVVHAAKRGMAGKGGELILAARFVRSGDREVRLRAFKAGIGEDRLDLAAGLGVTLGIPALFVVGKELVVPAGADVFAKVAADALLPSVLGTGATDIAPPAEIVDSHTEINNDEQSEQ